jgi:hypothetical protein
MLFLFRAFGQTARRRSILKDWNKVAMVQTPPPQVLRFSLANHEPTVAPHSSIIAPTRCHSPDQAAHYRTLGPKLGASSLTPTLGGSWNKSTSYITAQCCLTGQNKTFHNIKAFGLVSANIIFFICYSEFVI